MGWMELVVALVIADMVIVWACLRASAKADAAQEWTAREILHIDHQKMQQEADMLREAMEEEQW